MDDEVAPHAAADQDRAPDGRGQPELGPHVVPDGPRHVAPVVDPRGPAGLHDPWCEAVALERPLPPDLGVGVHALGRPVADRGHHAVLVADHGGGIGTEELSHLLRDGTEQLRRRRTLGDERGDAAQRRLLVGEPGELVAQRRVLRPQAGVGPAQRLLQPQPVLDVGEGHDGAAAAVHLERDRRVGDGEHRAVAPDEPVEVARDLLAGRERPEERAVGGGERRPAQVPVVDRRMALAPRELLRSLVAQRADRRRVGEPDHALGIDDPDGLLGRLEHGGEELLDTEPQAGEIDKGLGHPRASGLSLCPGTQSDGALDERDRIERVAAVARPRVVVDVVERPALAPDHEPLRGSVDLRPPR